MPEPKSSSKIREIVAAKGIIINRHVTPRGSHEKFNFFRTGHPVLLLITRRKSNLITITRTQFICRISP